MLFISSAHAQIKPCGGESGAIVEDEAVKAGLDPLLMRRICQIESGGDRTAVTGRYKGLFQLSDAEFREFGGNVASIMNARENSRIAMLIFKRNAAIFRARYGRDPDATDAYMDHQQGTEGYAAHLADPSRLAWQSMCTTGEGRQRGESWCRETIWGNAPPVRRGSENNLTSAAFVELWRTRVEGPATRECRMPDGMVGRMR